MRYFALCQFALGIDDEDDQGPFNNLHKKQQIGAKMLKVARKKVQVVNIVRRLLFEDELAEVVEHRDEDDSE